MQMIFKCLALFVVYLQSLSLLCLAGYRASCLKNLIKLSTITSRPLLESSSHGPALFFSGLPMHQQHPSSVQVSKSCWGIFPLAISHHPAVTAVTSPPVSSRLENPMDSLHSPSWILHTVAKVVQLWPGPLTSEQGLLLSCVKRALSPP